MGPLREGAACRVAAIGAWLLVAGTGYGALVDYATTEGSPAAAPSTWPDDGIVRSHRGRPTLVIAVHPQCPCTRASLEELARLMLRIGGRVDARALFFVPEDPSEPWSDTDLWDQAKRIEAVEVIPDVAGRQTERFGLKTSGAVSLYDADGRLVFTGGLTFGRGHRGDSFGRDQILGWLERGAGAARGPVYGCAMSAPSHSKDAP